LERREGLDVDGRVVRAEARVREPALGHAAVDGHLTAFVARTAARAGALAPALVAAARRLAQAAAHAASDATPVGVADAELRDCFQVHVFTNSLLQRSELHA